MSRMMNGAVDYHIKLFVIKNSNIINIQCLSSDQTWQRFYNKMYYYLQIIIHRYSILFMLCSCCFQQKTNIQKSVFLMYFYNI